MYSEQSIRWMSPSRIFIVHKLFQQVLPNIRTKKFFVLTFSLHESHGSLIRFTWSDLAEIHGAPGWPFYPF
jgi:hypothetical protein